MYMTAEMVHNPEYDRLIQQIREWNMNRLDLFEISFPNERLEFFGVIRFFFQDEDLKYQSKCLRVSSRATTAYLVGLLIQKFHPDMRMLNLDKYALYECHTAEQIDRRMEDYECPLVVQLNWAMDDREGKFVLKNESRPKFLTAKRLSNGSHATSGPTSQSQQTSSRPASRSSTPLSFFSSTKSRRRSLSEEHFKGQSSGEPTQQEPTNNSGGFGFRRRLSSASSKRRQSRMRDETVQNADVNSNQVDQPPDSSFTRTLSNSELMMRRKRQQKLEARLHRFSTGCGPEESGGTLKIYGEKLDPKVPYKTLLLSTNDTAASIVHQTLEKYGMGMADQQEFCLYQVLVESSSQARSAPRMLTQHRLRDTDCPLGILLHDPPPRGHYTFHVERRNESIPLRPREMPPRSLQQQQQPPPSSVMSATSRVRPPSAMAVFRGRATPTPSLGWESNFSAPNFGPARSSYMPTDFSSRGSVQRSTTPNFQEEWQSVHSSSSNTLMSGTTASLMTVVPLLVEVNPDGSEKMPGRVHRLTSLVPPSLKQLLPTSVADSGCPPYSSVRIGSSLQNVGPPPGIVLSGPLSGLHDIWPLHCILQREFPNGEGRLLLTPAVSESSKYPKVRASATVLVNGVVVKETSVLPGDADLCLGSTGMHHFRVVDPAWTGEGEDAVEGSFVDMALSPRAASEVEDPLLTPTPAVNAPSVLGSFRQQLPPVPDSPSSGSSSLLNGGVAEELPVLIDYPRNEAAEVIECILEPSRVATEEFPLVPAYALYCVVRAALRHTPEHVEDLISSITATIHKSQQGDHLGSLCFGLANGSELLHFLQHDEDVTRIFRQRELTPLHEMAHCVELIFVHLQHLLQRRLDAFLLEAFLHDEWTQEDAELCSHLLLNNTDGDLTKIDNFLARWCESEDGSVRSVAAVLQVLAEGIHGLRQCRVNAALSIQLFSQLFHHVNHSLFNHLLQSANQFHAQLTVDLCEKLQRRLACVRCWAECHGLGLAAECHMQTIEQTCRLMLLSRESCAGDIVELYERVTSLTALNSLQVGFLLTYGQEYFPQNKLPTDWVELLLTGVREVADKALQEDTGEAELQLFEYTELHLPLLMPEDGYSCDEETLLGPVATRAVLTLLRPLYQRGLLRKCITPKRRRGDVEPSWRAHLTYLQRGGPSQQSIITYEAFGGPGRNSYRRRNSSSKSQEATPSPSGKTSRSDLQKAKSPSPPPLPPHRPSQPKQQVDSSDVSMSPVVVRLRKVNHSLGLSIVAVLIPGHSGGVYIREVLPGGAAALDGRIMAGDQLLQVDNVTLNTADKEEAVRAMRKSASWVTLTLLKDAARKRGIWDSVKGGGNTTAASPGDTPMIRDSEERDKSLQRPFSRPPLPPPPPAYVGEQVPRHLRQSSSDLLTPTPSSVTANSMDRHGVRKSSDDPARPSRVSASFSADHISNGASGANVHELVWTETDFDANRMRKFRPTAAATNGGKTKPAPTENSSKRATSLSPTSRPQYVRVGPLQPTTATKKPVTSPGGESKSIVYAMVGPGASGTTNAPGSGTGSKQPLQAAQQKHLEELQQALSQLEARPRMTLSPLEQENLARLRVEVERTRRQLSGGVISPPPSSSKPPAKPLQPVPRRRADSESSTSSSDSSYTSSSEYSSSSNNSTSPALGNRPRPATAGTAPPSRTTTNAPVASSSAATKRYGRPSFERDSVLSPPSVSASRPVSSMAARPPSVSGSTSLTSNSYSVHATSPPITKPVPPNNSQVLRATREDAKVTRNNFRSASVSDPARSRRQATSNSAVYEPQSRQSRPLPQVPPRPERVASGIRTSSQDDLTFRDKLKFFRQEIGKVG